MAQQVEHVLGKDEVTGSSPVSSSIKVLPLEGLLFIGSSPSSSISIKVLSLKGPFYFIKCRE